MNNFFAFFAFVLSLLLSAEAAFAQQSDIAQITPPSLVTDISIAYPASLIEKGIRIDTEVPLLVTISEIGVVTEVFYVSEITPPEFAIAASQAVTSASFSPARLPDGSPIAVQINVTIPFIAPPAPIVTGAIEGTLFRRGDKTRLKNAVVTVVETGEEVNVGPDGTFEFSALPASDITLKVLAPDYEVLTMRETIVENELVSVEYFVQPEFNDELSLVIEGQKERKEVSRQRLVTEELVNVPGVGQDALRVVQILPGVVTPSDFSGELIVRGSDTRDNFLEIDGLPVPFVFHLLGLSSVLSSFAVDTIDFYPSNFGARYGDAIGGAFTIESRDPDQEVWRGSANVGTLLAEAYTEGPIGKNTSLLVSARRSYFDAILKAALPDTTGFAFTTAPQFSDYQLKLTHTIGKEHKISFFLNGAVDQLRLLFDEEQLVDPESFQDFQFKQSFHQARVRYKYQKDGKFFNDLLIGLSTGGTDTQVDSESLYFELYDDLFRIREEATYKFDSKTTVRAGTRLDFSRNRINVLLPRQPRLGEYDYDFLTAERVTAETSQDKNLYVLYAELEQELGPVRLIAGLHATTLSLAPYWFADPRFQVQYQASENTTLKAAAGVYQQFPEAQQFIEEAGGNPDTDPPGGERSFHYLLGFEQKLPWDLELVVEGYFKDIDRVIRQTDDILSRVRFFNDSVGRAYGGEFTLRKPFSKDVFGWLNYSYSKSERKDPGQDWSPFEFDQPHIFNAVLSWAINAKWRVGSRYRYATGNPLFSTDNVIYYADRQQYIEVPSRTRDRRQGEYQRLDIRVDNINRFDKWKLTNYIEILNVFLHDNPVGETAAYDFSERETFNSFPILVNFGIKADF